MFERLQPQYIKYYYCFILHKIIKVAFSVKFQTKKKKMLYLQTSLLTVTPSDTTRPQKLVSRTTALSCKQYYLVYENPMTQLAINFPWIITLQL